MRIATAGVRRSDCGRWAGVVEAYMSMSYCIHELHACPSGANESGGSANMTTTSVQATIATVWGYFYHVWSLLTQTRDYQCPIVPHRHGWAFRNTKLLLLRKGQLLVNARVH